MGARMSKIDVRDIIRDHFATLRNNERNRPAWLDWFVFVGIPILVTIGVMINGFDVHNGGSLLSAVAIVGGLFFALLILLLEAAMHTSERAQDSGVPPTNLRLQILRELKANVAYAVLVSVVTTTVLAIAELSASSHFDRAGHEVAEPLPKWLTATTVFLLVHLGITLLMVLKRMYRVLTHELSDSEMVRH